MNYGNAFWITAKARLTQHMIEASWEKTLETKEPQSPWDLADTWPVARLQHEPTNTDLFVLEGADDSSLAFGPGHMSSTDAPGEGVSVIGGHRDTHFEFLREVQLRDELLLQDKNGKWRHYLVDQINIVDSEEDPLFLPYDENRLVLITCFPFDNWVPGGPQRFIVHAELISQSHNKI